MKGEWTGVVKKPSRTASQPRGRAPLGATWDYDKGEWVGGTKLLRSRTQPVHARAPEDATFIRFSGRGQDLRETEEERFIRGPTPEKSKKKRRIRPKALEAASESRRRRGGAALCSRRGQRGISRVWPVARRFPRRRRQRGFRGRRDHEPISAAEAAQTKKEKRRGPPLDSLSRCRRRARKATQRGPRRPFLDTKRCTQPPGPRVPKKRPPKPELVVEKVEALSGRVLLRDGRRRAWAREEAG